MKHIRLIAIACACALAIASCSPAQADKAASNETEQTTAQTDDDHVLTPASDSQFRPGMKPEELTVIDFNATWCGPCKVFAPIFHKAAAKYGDVKFYSVDIDIYEDTANAFGIHAVPTIMLISPDGATKTIIGIGAELTDGITEEMSDEEAEAIVLANFCKLIDASK